MKLQLKDVTPYLGVVQVIHHRCMFRNGLLPEDITLLRFVGVTDVIPDSTFDIIGRSEDAGTIHDSRGHFKLVLKNLIDLSDEDSKDIVLDLGMDARSRFDKLYLTKSLKDISDELRDVLIMKGYDVFGLIENELAIDIKTIDNILNAE